MNDFMSQAQSHSLSIDNREKCCVTGVLEVISFDEDEIVMETVRGNVTIEGSNLHVEKLSLDGGELVLDGVIDAIMYSEEKRGKKGFWGRFF